MGWGSRCRAAALACALAVAALGCETESGAIITITSNSPLPDDAHLIIAVGLEVAVDPNNPRAHFFDPGAAELSIDRDLTIDPFRYFITPNSVEFDDSAPVVPPFPVAAAVVTADYSDILAMGTASDLVRFADGEVREYQLILNPTAGPFTGCLGGDEYVIEIGEESCLCADGSLDCEPPICLPNNEFFLPQTGETVSYEACDSVPDSDCNVDTQHSPTTVCYAQRNGNCRVGVTMCAERGGPSQCEVPDVGDTVTALDHGIDGRNICADWDACAAAADQVACTHTSLGNAQGATLGQMVCRPRYTATGSCGDSFDLAGLFPADDPLNCDVFAFIGSGSEWLGWSVILNGPMGLDRTVSSPDGCVGTMEFMQPPDPNNFQSHSERLLSVNGASDTGGLRSSFVRVLIMPEQVASCAGEVVPCEFAQ